MQVVSSLMVPVFSAAKQGSFRIYLIHWLGRLGQSVSVKHTAVSSMLQASDKVKTVFFFLFDCVSHGFIVRKSLLTLDRVHFSVY